MIDNTDAARKRSTPSRGLLGAVLIVVTLGIAAVLFAVLYGGPARAERSDPSKQPPMAARPASPAEFSERNGMEVLMLGVTAGGGLIDMRFRVTDVEKATLLLDEAHRPRLIAEGSGTVLTQHIRPEYKVLEKGRTYYLLFSNAQNAIRPGDRVAVELGGLRLEHLPAR